MPILYQLTFNESTLSQTRYIKLDCDPALSPDDLESAEEASFDLASVLHGRIAKEYAALPERLRHMSEFDLCAELQPNPSEYKMRQNFSEAVKVARESGKQIRVTSIYDGVIARATFFDLYASNPLAIAFITRPVVPHHSYYDAIFKEGLRKLFLYVRQHDLDPKNMATFMKLIEKAGDRVIGPVAQRIQMHQKQEVTHTSADPRDVSTPDDPEQLRAKIKEMQAKLSQVRPLEIEAKRDEEA